MKSENNLIKTLVSTSVSIEEDSEKLLRSALLSNLQMTYESRIESHENARELMNDLRKSGEKLYAKPQSTS